MSLPQPCHPSSTSSRVLACMLCQHRKIKCDRTFPCSQCQKSDSQCVPATRLPRQRRQRFAERDLLARLRHYETLLKEHKVDFEPLHPDHDGPPRLSTRPINNYIKPETSTSQNPMAEERPEPAKENYEAKSFWSAMNASFRDGEDEENDSDYDNLQYGSVRKTWDEVHSYTDRLFFGTTDQNVDLSPLHPSSIQIIRLYQIYLDNVNPLLKLTHPPDLQARIIEAASNPGTIGRELEALMFSIYCMAITSLAREQCHNVFGSTRDSLLAGYQFACQQALAKCEFLRTTDRECLTAIYLYLLSAMPFTDPRSLSSMLGIVVRTAQRLELYSEANNTRAGPLEGEIRRRLWWAIVVFDARISEMSNHKEGMLLAPTWDCMVPLNVNDSDLRSELKSPPVSQSTPTDAIFAAVRAEMARYVRKTNFHLDFTNPALKKLTPIDKLDRQLQSTSLGDLDGSELDELDLLIESRYLRNCDEDVPLHFMTMWYARGYIARCRLIEFYSRCATRPSETLADHSPAAAPGCPTPTESQRETALGNALMILECDTKIMMSPLTRGFLWLMDHNFPIVAYFQVVQFMRRRPLHADAPRAWDVMDANFEARFVQHQSPRDESGNPLVHFFAKVVLGAWAAREMALATQSSSLDPLPSTPQIVQGLRRRMAGQFAQFGVSDKTEHLASGTAADPFLMGSNTSAGSLDYGMMQDLPTGLLDIDVSMQMGFEGTVNTFDPSMYPLDFSSMYGGT